MALTIGSLAIASCWTNIRWINGKNRGEKIIKKHFQCEKQTKKQQIQCIETKQSKLQIFFAHSFFSRTVFHFLARSYNFFIILSLLWPSYISDAIIQFTIDWDSRAPAWNFPTSVLSNGKARKWKRLKKCSENRKESNITFDEHDGNNIKKNEWMRNNARYVNVHINTIWIVFRANCCTHIPKTIGCRVIIVAANKRSLCLHTPSHRPCIQFQSVSILHNKTGDGHNLIQYRAYIIIGINFPHFSILAIAQRFNLSGRKIVFNYNKPNAVKCERARTRFDQFQKRELKRKKEHGSCWASGSIHNTCLLMLHTYISNMDKNHVIIISQLFKWIITCIGCKL